MKFKQGIYIGTALEDGKDYDFTPDRPKPLVIVLIDGNEEEKLLKMGQNESNKIDYQMNMAEYNDKIKTYGENRYKAYCLLWDKCSPQMRQSIETKADYKTAIKNNPFELLKTIEALSYNYQESRYEIAIMADAIRTFVNLKQKDDENLTNYLDRFKAASDNMLAQKGSPVILSKYIESFDDYDTTTPNHPLPKHMKSIWHTLS